MTTRHTLPTFGAALRDARKRSGMRMVDLLAAVNEATGNTIHPAHIIGWESGSRTPPSPRVIAALAEILGQDPVAWTVAAGKIHPVITEALTDPAFARQVYELATTR